MLSRIRNSSDIIELTAVPTLPNFDVTRGADVFSRHAQLLFALADHVALGVTQRVFGAHIVTHEATVRADLAANTVHWYTWSKRGLDEGDAVELQRLVGAFNTAAANWARAIFELRAEQWQADDAARAAREAAAAARITELDAARAAIAAGMTALLQPDDDTTALDTHWQRLAEAMAARADGIASSDGRAIRKYNALQAAAEQAARDLGRRLDAASPIES